MVRAAGGSGEPRASGGRSQRGHQLRLPWRHVQLRAKSLRQAQDTGVESGHYER